MSGGKLDYIFGDDHYVRQVWDSPIVGLALVGGDGIVYELNNSFCDLLKRGRHEIIGRHLDDYTVIADHIADHYLMEGIKSGQLPNYEKRKKFRVDDDRTIDVLIGVRAILDHQGEFVCYCYNCIPLDLIRTRENVVVQYIPPASEGLGAQIITLQTRLDLFYKSVGIIIGVTSIGAGLCVGAYYLVKFVDFVRQGMAQ